MRALDLKRLNKDLRALLTGKKVQLPRYDFLSGLSVDGETAQLKKDDIIILEGIHGMNPPDLLEGIGAEETFKIYVSCLTQLNLDRHNRISTTDTRLLRRILRDSRDRGIQRKKLSLDGNRYARAKPNTSSHIRKMLMRCSIPPWLMS